MTRRDIWILIAVGVVTTVIGNVVAHRWIQASRPRPRVLPFSEGAAS